MRKAKKKWRRKVKREWDVIIERIFKIKETNLNFLISLLLFLLLFAIEKNKNI